MKKAYSYTRFSSRIQAKGGSRERQQESFEVSDFIRHHKLNVVQYIVDEGVSGFRGKNFSETAALGRFVEEIRKGRIAVGSVLIVENLDRFSRDNIADCITRFMEIIRSGVSIGIVAMNLVIDLEQMNNNQLIWNYVSNEFQRARAESKRKSGFQKNNIAQKIARAKTGEKVFFGAQCPVYLKGVKNGRWIVDDDLVHTTKRIFDLYLSGLSCVGIAKKLNEEKVPLAVGKHWFNTSIRHILSNRNLIGYCKINDLEANDYYPRIIEDDIFYKVQARLELNKANRGGSTTGDTPNIFKGMLFCKCGCGIDVQTYHYKDKVYRYCQCRNAPLRACEHKTKWKMKHLEETIFLKLLEKTPAEALERPKAKTNSVLTKLNTELGKTNMLILRTIDFINDPNLTDVGELRGNLITLQQKRTALKTQIQQEASKQAVIKANPASVLKLVALFNASKSSVSQYDEDGNWTTERIVLFPNDDKKAIALYETIMREDRELVRQALKDNQVRAELRNLLPDIISRIDLDLAGHSISVSMTSGTEVAMHILK